MERETISYLMLFCTLLLTQKGRATFEQAMTLAPLAGGAGLLAEELLQSRS